MASVAAKGFSTLPQTTGASVSPVEAQTVAAGRCRPAAATPAVPSGSDCSSRSPVTARPPSLSTVTV